MAQPNKKLPLVDVSARPKPVQGRQGGWQAFTDHGTAPAWITAARVILVLAFAATIPTILGVRHGNRLLWTVAIASLPFFWTTGGFHVWRRICPLAVAGQVGRLLGYPGTRKMGDFMGKHYLLVQLGIMILALSLRLVVTNGSDVGLAIFLGAITAAAIAVSFIYGGKTWCNFLCPVGLVEKLYTEPARSSSAAAGALSSQCVPCVACKKHCPDIDLEQGYWKEVSERSRRIAYFTWPGVVVGFYTYFYLATGRWSYYFSGEWAYERGQLADTPGFYFAPSVPRWAAAPLTLVAFGLASYLVFEAIARLVARSERSRHVMFALAGLVAFNGFYCFAGQPTLQKLPSVAVTAWGLLVVFSSTAIFMRRVGRREDKYVQEKFAQKILKKWEWGDAPPSDELKDIYLLHTERTKQREARLRAYKETVRELVADGLVTRNELAILVSLRAQLGVSDKDHQKIIGELSAEERQLFDPDYHGSVELRLARQQYRRDLERLVVEAARQGASPAASTLAALREDRGIDEGEETRQLDEILAPGGPIAAIYEQELANVRRLLDAKEASTAPDPSTENQRTNDSASLSLLRHLAHRRAHEHAVHALGILAVMTKNREIEAMRAHAKNRGGLDADHLDSIEGLDAKLRAPLAEVLRRMQRDDTRALEPATLLQIATDGSPHLRAVVAMLLSRFDDDASRSGLLGALDDVEPIVREAAVRAMGAKSRLTRELLTKVLADESPLVRSTAVRIVAGTKSEEMTAVDPSALAQTTKGVGQLGAYATLDVNAAMSSLTTIEKMMLIRQVPIFAELDADDLEELASIVEEVIVNANKNIFSEGDEGDAVYLIVKGKVRVYVGGGQRPERTLNELGPGSCVGEMAVLDSEPRAASVLVLERTRALRVPGDEFKRVMSERPEMSEAVVAELVRRMRRLTAEVSKVGS